MPGKHGHSPYLAATRYGVLGFVVLGHLALGGWLLRGIAPSEQPIRQSPLAPTLIQEVMIVAAAVRQPAATARARVEAPPEPVPRPGAPAKREVRPDSTVMTPAPTTTTIPMGSRVLQSSEPATLSAPAPAPAPAEATVGQPATSSLATPSAVPPAGSAPSPARSASSLPAQPQSQPSGPSSTESGIGAVSANIALVCPTQVAPVMPEFARRGGISGVVEARVVVLDGLVRDVEILSGPPIFHNAVRHAMLQYRCVPNRTEVLGTQRFTFQ